MEPRTTQWFNPSSPLPSGAPADPPATRSETPTTGLRGPDDTEPSGGAGNLELGQAIGKYELRGRLGQGGQARAFLAYDPDLHRQVVIKFYHDVKDSADRETVLNEGRALARVRSPFVAQCHGADRHNGIPYLVLEYVPGTTLGELCKAKRLEVPRALKLASQIAEGLAAIHACGLLHLDLKPSNILIGDDDRPRIVDFGLATTVGSERLRKISGTPAYMAPEQARGDVDRIDARADVFGLGAVLYELLTGQPPYQGESQISIWNQAKSGQVNPASQQEPRLAPAVNDLCMRCLAKDPVERWRSAAELQQRLAEFDRSQRKGFGFLFQLGRFKLQFSIGLTLASVLLMVGALTWLPEVFDGRRPVTIAKTDLAASPDAPSPLEGASMMAGGADVAAPWGPAQDKRGALLGLDPAESMRGNPDASPPAPFPAFNVDAKSQRDGTNLVRKAAALRQDFDLVVAPVAPSRRRGEALEVPAGESLAFELSTDHACVASAWLRHANGDVVQLLPNEFDSDARLEPGVARQIPPRRPAADVEIPASDRDAKRLAGTAPRYRLPQLEAGERAQLFVVARTKPLPPAFQPAKEFRRWNEQSRQQEWEAEIRVLLSEASAVDEPRLKVVELVIPVQAEERP